MCFAKGRSPKLSSLSPGQRRSHSGPTLQSQKALDAVAAAGDQTTQYRQVQLDLTEERTKSSNLCRSHMMSNVWLPCSRESL